MAAGVQLMVSTTSTANGAPSGCWNGGEVKLLARYSCRLSPASAAASCGAAASSASSRASAMAAPPQCRLRLLAGMGGGLARLADIGGRGSAAAAGRRCGGGRRRKRECCTRLGSAFRPTAAHHRMLH